MRKMKIRRWDSFLWGIVIGPFWLGLMILDGSITEWNGLRSSASDCAVLLLIITGIMMIVSSIERKS